MNPTITYTRGTTYNLTHTYSAPQYLGSHLIFTVKTVKNDSDITDLTNAVMTPKVLAMSGSSFPQTTAIVIEPGDVPVTMEPGNYFYSIKVVDTDGEEFIAVSGSFVLVAVPTNDITP
jgi:hypothetical protein